MTNESLLQAIREALEDMPTYNMQICGMVNKMIYYVDRAEVYRILKAIETAAGAKTSEI